MDFMDFLFDLLKENCPVISIVGLAKNSGKTTVLNYIIKNLENDTKLGITSIGRDGEPYDIITDLPKPLIFIKRGTLIATAEETIKASEVDVSTIKNSPYNTPLGNIKIVEAINDGFIELAGPSINNQLFAVLGEFKKLGCNLILIDGAFDRKSYGTPLISDYVILSTGASVSEKMEVVIDKTLHTVNILTLPREENIKIRDLTKDIFKKAKVGLINNSFKTINLDISTLLGYEKQILDKINEDINYLVVKGALTDKLLKILIKEHRYKKKITIIIEDATKLFVEKKVFSNFLQTGNEIKVMKAINLIAIAINPTSPYGYRFESSKFMKKLKLKTKIPIFDIGIQ